jgi:ADP-ribosylglycohydrolase
MIKNSYNILPFQAFRQPLILYLENAVFADDCRHVCLKITTLIKSVQFPGKYQKFMFCLMWESRVYPHK